MRNIIVRTEKRIITLIIGLFLSSMIVIGCGATNNPSFNESEEGFLNSESMANVNVTVKSSVTLSNLLLSADDESGEPVLENISLAEISGDYQANFSQLPGTYTYTLTGFANSTAFTLEQEATITLSSSLNVIEFTYFEGGSQVQDDLFDAPEASVQTELIIKEYNISIEDLQINYVSDIVTTVNFNLSSDITSMVEFSTEKVELEYDYLISYQLLDKTGNVLDIFIDPSASMAVTYDINDDFDISISSVFNSSYSGSEAASVSISIDVNTTSPNNTASEAHTEVNGSFDI
ncbi:MAG: hypothetical protein ABIA04_00085 [Pseudomonadota bacterium]